MHHVLNEETAVKFAQYGRNVWQINETVPMMAARMAIQKTYDYFKACGIPMTLPEVGIEDDRKFEVMAKQAVAYSKIATDAFVPLQVEDVVKIYQDSLVEQNYL